LISFQFFEEEHGKARAGALPIVVLHGILTSLLMQQGTALEFRDYVLVTCSTFYPKVQRHSNIKGRHLKGLHNNI
jgi:hypothetical protein